MIKTRRFPKSSTQFRRGWILFAAAFPDQGLFTLLIDCLILHPNNTLALLL